MNPARDRHRFWLTAIVFTRAWANGLMFSLTVFIVFDKNGGPANTYQPEPYKDMESKENEFKEVAS